MDISMKIETVKALADDPTLNDEGIIMVYLKMAEAALLARLYPYSDSTDLPSKYDMTECELAVRYLARRGAEGETRHEEGSVIREYSDDEDILSRVVPFVG